MIARRQVFLSFLSLLAALTVPAVTRALPPFGQTRLPLEPVDEESLLTSGEAFNVLTVIKVIGVGGGGRNMVEHMIAGETHGIEFIYADTDTQSLSRSAVHKTVQLGTAGLGAGSEAAEGRSAAQATVGDIRAAIDGAHMLFIVASMGGSTGTGAAPVIARIAREMGILTVGVVTKPFDWEGGLRMSNANAGMAELEANVDSLIVVPCEKLREVLGDGISQEQTIAHAHDMLKNVVGDIAEIINVPGLMGVDFEDVRIVMSESGKAMIGTAVATGPERARIASEQAVACPLLGGFELSGAKGVLVLLSAAKRSLRLRETTLATKTIRAYASVDADFIYGTAIDDSLGEQIRVTVIATGVRSGGATSNNWESFMPLRRAAMSSPWLHRLRST